jgi:thiosulfate/3-mercaptopyruvate sulfurtransferase
MISFSNRMCSTHGLVLFGLVISVWPASDQALAQQGLPGATRLSVADVLKVKNDDDWILVDARATDAFNGWALDGINRGGHIPHAVDFPASWLEGDQKGKTERLATVLRTKGIERDKHIVLYSTKERDRRRLADYLRQTGFRKLYSLDLKKWAADKSRPLVRYRNFHLLLPASIVKRLLEGHLPETFENAKRVKFVEVSWGDEDASYSKGHVPSSFHVNTDHFEPPPQWKLGNPAVLTGFATRYGFQADDTVVISGKDPMASYRLAIVLQYMGVSDVRVLNGGFAAWKAARFPVETRSQPPAGAKSFGARIPVRPTLIDDLARVKAGLRKPEDFVLVDNRTWAEFIGKTSGYKYHFRKGRIPGSTYGQAGFTGANSLTPYRNIDNTMRNADEILALWKKAGISTDKHLSFMCGGGWRAAEVLTFARVIGLPNTSLYSDGWIGWSNDRQNPIETGATSKTPGP